MNTISRLRRLGTDHTFISGPNHHRDDDDDRHHQVEVHQSETTPVDERLYERMPGEKEFGTLAVLRTVIITSLYH